MPLREFSSTEIAGKIKLHDGEDFTRMGPLAAVVEPAMSTAIKHWMSWEGGVDLVGMTAAGLAMPNVIVHVGRLVHTPVGSAAAGVILWQPDPAGAPAVMGFFATDAKVGAYFGPTLFAGTPFEQAPVMAAKVEVQLGADGGSARIEAGGHLFETKLGGLGPATLIPREPGMQPFWQQGVEQPASRASLKIDGKEIALASTAGSVVAPSGVYAR
jgi:hypothetical protein